MTVQDLGSIGEVVGAVATVATLIYLALQIRANTRATKAETRRTNQSNRLQAYSEIIAHEEVALIFEKALAHPESLSSTERIRFDFLFSKILGDAAVLMADHRDGLETSQMLDRTISGVLPMLRTAGGRAYWSRWGKTFDPEFQTRVELVLQGEPPPNGRSAA